jgi:hypothetical protein
VLEETGSLANSPYLFHGNYVVAKYHRRMTSRQLSKRLTSYLRLVDNQGKWSKVNLHAHQFRNSLAFELRKAGLSLPFITFQLKHLYYAVEHRINNTTIGYGTIASGATQKAITDANMEALREIFHPAAALAGGGAEQHKKRCAAYFEGMALHGFNVEDILHHLANQGGIPLTDVGLAFCQGKTKVEIDGIETEPPCINQLLCNPIRCPNGVIPEHKAIVWEKVMNENRQRANDPEFAFARSYLEESANEAEAVVRFLQGQKRRKDSDGK